MVNTHTVTDQMQRILIAPVKPMRIVSLVPSQTELLFDLGLGNRVVGITKFCIHPNEWFRSKIRVGGTKNVNFDTIKQLAPDLIIGNKEENDRKSIEQLMQQYTVWMSDIKSLADAKAMISAIGNLTQTADNADSIISEIDEGFEGLIPLKPARSVLYLIWRGPYMAAGAGTFIYHILESCGFYAPGPLSDIDIRYPELSEEQIFKLNPEFVFLSSEPYPFKDKHIQELQELLPHAKIMLVVGEMFSWFGSRLIHTGPYLKGLLSSLAL